MVRIGDFVRYVISAKKVRPAIVVEVLDDFGLVELTVFYSALDCSSVSAEKNVYAEYDVLEASGTWHHPPRKRDA